MSMMRCALQTTLAEGHDWLLVVNWLAFLLSLFVAGCLIGALLSNHLERSYADRRRDRQTH